MADRGLKVIDGADLRSTDLTLPELTSTVTGDHLIKLVESAVSASLFGLALPEYLKSSALRRLDIGESLATKEFQVEEARVVAKDLIAAVADQLQGLLHDFNFFMSCNYHVYACVLVMRMI